jgi:quinolinate synthase
MAMNELETLAGVFDRDDNEIFVDPALGEQAMVPLRRMLEFAAALRVPVKGNA